MRDEAAGLMGLSVGVAGVGRRVEDAEGTQWRRWGGRKWIYGTICFFVAFFSSF